MLANLPSRLLNAAKDDITEHLIILARATAELFSLRNAARPWKQFGRPVKFTEFFLWNRPPIKSKINSFAQQKRFQLLAYQDRQLSEDAVAVPVQDGALVLADKVAKPRRKSLQKKNISSSTAVQTKITDSFMLPSTSATVSYPAGTGLVLTATCILPPALFSPWKCPLLRKATRLILHTMVDMRP